MKREQEGKYSISTCLLTQVTLLSGFYGDIQYCDITLLTFGWLMCNSLLFQNNGEKMVENLLFVKISQCFQECSPFLRGKVPATISVTHPVVLSACSVSP